MPESLITSPISENIPNLEYEVLEINNIIAQGLIEGGKITPQSRVLVVVDRTDNLQTNAEIEDAKNKIIEYCRARGADKITVFDQDWKKEAAGLAACTEPERVKDILKEQEEKIANSTAILILDCGQNFAQILSQASIRNDVLGAYRKRRREIRRPIDEGKTRWTLTRYPTEEQAKKAGISKKELLGYAKEAFQQDWPKITEAQNELVKILNQTDEIIISANIKDPNKKRRTALSLKLTEGEEKMTFVNDTPQTVGANVPGAEVFSSPVIGSANGQVYAEKCSFQGKEMRNVHFLIKAGKIIEASSDDPKSDEFIKEIIALDEGSSRLGEIAFGGNPGLAKMLSSGIIFSDPFWLEKIGGTFHFALGYALEDNELSWKDQKAHVDNGNRSIVHMDVVIPLMPQTGGGKIWLEGKENGKKIRKVLLEDGRFKGQKLSVLNSA